MQYYKWTDNTYFVGINSDATVVTVVPWKAQEGDKLTQFMQHKKN